MAKCLLVCLCVCLVVQTVWCQSDVCDDNDNNNDNQRSFVHIRNFGRGVACMIYTQGNKFFSNVFGFRNPQERNEPSQTQGDSDVFIFPNDPDENNANKKEDIVTVVESAPDVPPSTQDPNPVTEKTEGTTLAETSPPSFESRDIFGFRPTCATVDGGQGSCISLYNCSPYEALLQTARNNEQVRNILRSALCGFEGTTPKVCCPLPGLPSVPPPSPPPPVTPEEPPAVVPGDVAKPNTADGQDYVNELPQPPVCGLSGGSFTRVVNGVPAKLGDFPWMALLGYKGRRYPNKPRWLCGGSLVTSLHVLTAAHCIYGKEDELYQVRLGELDLERDDDGATPIDVPIKIKIMHQEYSSTIHTNDIAILVLDRHVQFTSLIKPICLPASDKLRSNTFARYTPFIAGWGNTQFRGIPATHLQTTQLPVVKNEKCARAYSAYEGKVIIDDRVLCAGFEQGGKDACQGDSGGPLMQPILDQGTYSFYQIGVVSFGRGCAEAGYPGIYSRITHFMPWLLEKITGQ